MILWSMKTSTLLVPQGKFIEFNRRFPIGFNVKSFLSDLSASVVNIFFCCFFRNSISEISSFLLVPCRASCQGVAESEA